MKRQMVNIDEIFTELKTSLDSLNRTRERLLEKIKPKSVNGEDIQTTYMKKRQLQVVPVLSNVLDFLEIESELHKKIEKACNGFVVESKRLQKRKEKIDIPKKKEENKNVQIEEVETEDG